MIDIDHLYFKWLMTQFEKTSPGLERLCGMLHQNAFERRVGNDMNRAEDGIALRHRFFEDYREINLGPPITNYLALQECSWFEMLLALSEALDFLYDEGVEGRFIELITNLGLHKIVLTKVDRDGRSPYDEVDQDLVDQATSRVDQNRFDANGQSGLFPLAKDHHPDQREVELWEQHSAYFRERLEGVVWTSTS